MHFISGQIRHTFQQTDSAEIWCKTFLLPAESRRDLQSFKALSLAHGTMLLHSGSPLLTEGDHGCQIQGAN